MEKTDDTLDDIFDAQVQNDQDKNAPPTDLGSSQTAEPQPNPETGVKPDGQEPPADAPPASEDTDKPKGPPETVPFAALEDERKKRQALEQQLGQMQDQMQQFALAQQQAMQQQQNPQGQQQGPQIPDPFEDPQGYAQYQQQMIGQAMQRQQAEMAYGMFANRTVLSQDMMRSQHEDYDEVEQVFATAAQQDPSLAQQMFQSQNPAKFAYEQGKRLKMMADMGNDPQAYINAQVESRLAEMNGGGQPAPTQQPAKRAPVPKSLAGQASAQPRDPKTGQFTDASLSELID